jgi:hypothetical protein
MPDRRQHISDRIAVWLTVGAAGYFTIHLIVFIASSHP